MKKDESMNFANDDFIQHLIEQYDYLLTSIRGFDTKKNCMKLNAWLQQ